MLSRETKLPRGTGSKKLHVCQGNWWLRNQRRKVTSCPPGLSHLKHSASGRISTCRASTQWVCPSFVGTQMKDAFLFPCLLSASPRKCLRVQGDES